MPPADDCVDTDLVSRAICLRRTLHAAPEGGIYQPKTRARIVNSLSRLPLDVLESQSSSSIVAIARGSSAPSGQGTRPSLVFRAMMGANVATERTNLAFASRNEMMYSNGNDLEVAALCGVAEAVCALQPALTGDIAFVFQTGSAGDGGVESIVDEGLLLTLQNPTVGVLALRYSADLPAGVVFTKPGQMTAEHQEFSVIVCRHNKPFDGAPAQPLRIATSIAAALYDFAKTSPQSDEFQLDVGLTDYRFQRDCPPDNVTLNVAVASRQPVVGEQLRQQLEHIICSTAAAANAMVKIGEHTQIPAVYNDAAAAEKLQRVGARLFTKQPTQQLPRALFQADDLSAITLDDHLLLAIMGARPASTNQLPSSTHNSGFAQFDDSVLADAIRFGSGLVTEFLCS